MRWARIGGEERSEISLRPSAPQMKGRGGPASLEAVEKDESGRME